MEQVFEVRFYVLHKRPEVGPITSSFLKHKAEKVRAESQSPKKLKGIG